MSGAKKFEGHAYGPFNLITRRDMLTGAMAFSLTFAAVPGLARAGAAQTGATDVAAPSKESLSRHFRTPPQAYAPVDNWWWEAAHVDKEKLTLQLQEMKDRGIGGTWFYPRWVYGESYTSDPPYWGDKWWELTRFSVEEHERIGLTHFFSNWTLTQFQQNMVRKEKESNPSLEGRILVLHQRDSSGTLELGAGEELIEAAAFKKNGTALDYSTRKVLTESVRGGKLKWKSPGDGWVVAAIAAKPWDLNYLSKTVGDRFTESYLGEYQKHLPEHIGKTLQSYGADEMIMLAGEIIFSNSLLDRVRSQRGYDPTPHLIGLFYDIGTKTDQIRCDYYDAMTTLLEQNFYKPPSDWLESRGMQHSVLSQLGAGDALLQTAQLGDFFRYMRTFHIQGNEDPQKTKPGKRRLMATKLSSSIGHLYNRERVVLCVHYATGWGQTQQENMAWTNESYAKGHNLYVRHGNYYTLLGGWYEWVPPGDHFHQPIWRYWKTFTQYITRLSYLLSQGKHRADVALFYPITTIHANWVGGRNATEWTMQEEIDASGPPIPFDPPAVQASRSLKALAEVIYDDGIDFNFTDNDSLDRATIEGPVLEIAGVQSRSIVLPALSTIRLASMQKLRDFYEAGGTVVSFGRLPTASAENGRDDPQLRALVEAVFGVVSEGATLEVSRSNAQGGKAFFVPAEAKRVPELLSQALVRDVAAPEKELFVLHKKIGELDVYFLFNVREEARKLPVQFRSQGRVEIWDAFTGESRPVHHWKRVGEQQTEVQLRMGPNEGVVVVFSPEEPAPAVLEDNLGELVKIEAKGLTLTVQGFDETGGKKQIRVRQGKQDYVATGSVATPPKSIKLEGSFAFSLEPTMNNRWGDFRHPASQTMIGAEARQFRYAEEEAGAGTDRNWHRADFDDAAWPEVTYSYGPYWWHLGGFASGSEPKELLQLAERGEIDVARSWGSGDKAVRWQREDFSKKLGSMKKLHPDGYIDGLLGIPGNFLMLNQPAPGNDTHYFLTYVSAHADGDYFLHAGVQPADSIFSLPYPPPTAPLPSRTRAWINGAELPVDIRAGHTDSRSKARLRKGWNTVLLEVVRPEEGPVALYAALFENEPPKADRYTALLRWFREPQPLVYDILPNETKRVGWYRFKAPPGVRALRLPTEGKVQAWVDGESVPVEGGQIRLSAPRYATSQVALRVEQARGAYGGAAFADPIAFECGTGQISLGDWSTQGLATYSGIGIYSREVRLDKTHLRCKVVLDLGVATSVAEVLVNGQPAGVKLARPFRFDITSLVKEGTNTVDIKVANTLANHMSTYPTKWVLEGQTVSGLLGPVALHFYSPVQLTAERA